MIASANNTIAETTPIIPNTGCISQITARKIGAQGTSKTALHAGTAEKRSRLREITQRLRVLRTAKYRRAQTGANEFRRQPAFQPLADAGLHFVAHHFQQAENQNGEAGDKRKQQQCLDLAAGEDAVVNLHHVDGRCQNQEVDKETEHREKDDAEAAFLER